MNRRRFFKALGVLSAAAVVAPAALAEIGFSKPLEPTDVLTKDLLRRAFFKLRLDHTWTGGYLTVLSTKIQENYAESRKICGFDRKRGIFYVTYPLSKQTMGRQFVHVCIGSPDKSLEIKGRYSVKYDGRLTGGG